MDLSPWIFLSLVMGLVVCQGGANVGSESIVSIIVGFFLFLRPPTHGLGTWDNRCVLALILLPFLSLLPADLLPCGAWRSDAILKGIQLPWTIPSECWNLAEHWTGAFALIGFCYIGCSVHWEHRIRQKILTIGCIIAIILGFVALLCELKGVKNPLIPDARVFSYFPSRNQTATFFMVWGIITFGLGLINQAHKKWKSVTWQWIGSIILLLATIQTHSRAGAILMLCGYLGVIFFSRREWGKKEIAISSISFILIGGSFFVLGGGDATRLLKLFSSGDFRFSLYADTLGLILDHWLTGTGLANFYTVIPFYREIGNVSQQTLHPESDLLWIMSELGIFGGIAVILLLAIAFKNTLPWSSDRELSLRTVVAIALTAYIAHSVIDVPMHFLGTALLGLFLYPLSTKIDFTPLPLWTFRAWRAMGIFLIGVGVIWGGGVLMDLPLHSLLAKKKQNAIIEELAQAPQIAEDWEKVFDEALQNRPMDWWLYTQRAGIHLNFERNFDAASVDFDRALFVEPISAAVAFSIGVMWLNWNLEKTYEAWDKALDRASADPDWLCEDMLRRSVSKDSFLPYLNKLSEKSLILKEKFFQHLNGNDFVLYFQQYLKSDPLLERFQIESRESFWIKYAKLKPEAFLKHQEANEALRDFWKGTVMSDFQQNLWQQGCELALEKAPLPPPLKVGNSYTASELARLFEINPKDTWMGMQLAKLHLERGDLEEARQTLEKLMCQEPVFPCVYYHQAVVYMKLNDFKASAKAWKKYLFKK